MAQFTRTKKLTDVAYSPTFAISEATRRAEVDGSIQEIADILYSTSNGKGASQVGLEGGSYATVQLLSEAVQASQTGFVPLDLSVTNAKLGVDVKVGSLATLNTTYKLSVVGAINEVDADVSLKSNKVQEDWIAPTLLNNWNNFDAATYSPCGYYKDEFGIVRLRGILKDGTVNVAFVLPLGYRPAYIYNFPIISNNVFGLVSVKPNGEVIIDPTAPVTTRSINAISFKVV